MIDIRELQLGNYLWLKDKIVEVDGISEYYGVNFMFFEGGYGDAGWVYKEDMSDFKPIPLTEDILIRCGFVLFSKTEFKISYNMPKHPFIEVIYNQTYHWHVRLYCSYRVDISSLHQLQNLVKLLTNQTIELK